MRLAEIWIYPVKGMRGLPLPFSAIENRGLTFDRRWVVADADCVFLSQRNTPQLAQVQPTPIPGGTLRLSHPSQEMIECTPRDHRRTVKVWQDDIDAVDCGDEVASWLSGLLSSPCRLLYMDDASRRHIHPDFGLTSDEVSFADGFPLLLANKASLDHLNKAMYEADHRQLPLPMNRFRPNLVIEGAAPWDEREWTQVRVGTATFRSVKPCARCLVTTTDQQSGERQGPEPLRTLTRIQALDGKPIFGMNLIPNEAATVSVGDPISVTRA